MHKLQFFQHNYFLTELLSELGTSFIVELQHELTDLLEFQLQHVSWKHPQTVGVVKRIHSALKAFFNLTQMNFGVDGIGTPT